MSWLNDLPRTPPTATPVQLRDRLQAAFTPSELAVAISTLPVSWLIAVIAGLDVVAGRDESIRLANYAGGRYYRELNLGRPTEYERRRYPPDGDRERWIREGPPGHVNYLGRKSREEDAA